MGKDGRGGVGQTVADFLLSKSVTSRRAKWDTLVKHGAWMG